MNVHIWNSASDGCSITLYEGPREKIPQELREYIALIDASDGKFVSGLGDMATLKRNRQLECDYYLCFDVEVSDGRAGVG